MDKKSLGSLMDDVAKTAPKKYNQVVYELKKIGDETATRTGSSFSLKDFKSPFKIEPFITKVEEKATRILNSNKSQEEKNFAIAQMYEKLGDDIDRKLVKDSLAKGNNLAVSVISGARGKTSQLRSTIGAPILVTDHKDNPIPVPLTKSYAEGADPASYWAASYGTRKGVVATKFATAEAGGFGKQLTLAA
ncbi:MAG: hypothetical protein GTO54_09555, partial [Nitrososphaeria archaeon]|nr:hypothetical protein [Nitrososphaeria archaeon]